MWILLIGFFWIYVVAVVIPTVRCGLIERPKLAADDKLWKVVAAYIIMAMQALIWSPRLSALRHQNVPPPMTHTVTNEELAEKAKRTKRRSFLLAASSRSRSHSPPREDQAQFPPHDCTQTTPASVVSTPLKRDSPPRTVPSPRDKPKLVLQLDHSATLSDPGHQSDGINTPELGGSGRGPGRAVKAWGPGSRMLHTSPALFMFPDGEGLGQIQGGAGALLEELSAMPRASTMDPAELRCNMLRAVAAAGRPLKRKLTVVLDLDECLIHSRFEGPEGDVYRQAESRPAAVRSVNSLTVSLGHGARVVVNKRPGLDQFIRILSREFHLVVFTAGKEEYASKVLAALDPLGTIFHQALFRDNCRQARGGVFMKDLLNVARVEQQRAGLLGGRRGQCTCHQAHVPAADPALTPEALLRRTVLVDNSPLSFICQPSNGILVSSWYDDRADDALGSVLQLLRYIATLDDVRPTLEELFRLGPVLKPYRDFVLKDAPPAAATGAAAAQPKPEVPAVDAATDMQEVVKEIDEELLGKVTHAVTSNNPAHTPTRKWAEATSFFPPTPSHKPRTHRRQPSTDPASSRSPSGNHSRSPSREAVLAAEAFLNTNAEAEHEVSAVS